MRDESSSFRLDGGNPAWPTISGDGFFAFFVVLADANNLEWCDRVKNKKAGVFPAQLLTCLLIVQIWSVFLG